MEVQMTDAEKVCEALRRVDEERNLSLMTIPKALAIADHVEAAQAVRNLAMLQAERDHPLIAAHDAALSRLREVLG